MDAEDGGGAGGLGGVGDLGPGGEEGHGRSLNEDREKVGLGGVNGCIILL